ncbi:dipeptide ABC transporter ATP-binding protein [Dongia deserti]|uniref:dipeptide ABC transporter ATP-binding protein n=1 Tax=Dongia deserti TaxID=2268030 RepID=UPI000E6544D9|nr:ABC transporter ATP-binding protein [Dongia deserti]
MTPLVQIRNLDVIFDTDRGPVRALRDVSFDVPRGKIVGVVGESGSGKSTVIWSIARLLSANGRIVGGKILFDGRNLCDLGEAALRDFRGRQASIVFQDPMTSQIPVKSYRQQIIDILYRNREQSRSQKIGHALAMMRRVGIPDSEQRIDQFPHQFSGGMRQRMGIAMALLMKPQLLMADEPTTALDVTMEAQIIHLLRSLQAEMHTTIILVSHNLGLVAELCDEVVVMYAGEVVERGPIGAVYARPAHPYTQALINSDPARVTERRRYLPTIPGDLPDVRFKQAGCIFAGRCPKAFDRCRHEEPAAHVLEEGHDARCHLLDPRQVASSSVTAASRQEGWVPVDPGSNVAATEPLVRVRDLRVSFPGRGGLASLLPGAQPAKIDVLVDVNLDLRAGETLGLVGESGSGKTTLGRCILGLIPASSGSITLRGRELTRLSEREFRPLRENMAMMFQDPVGSLSPRQSVRSLIVEPLDVHRPKGFDRDAVALKLADMVNLPRELLSRYPHQLSGGQARRVGVARALALEPDLIIADEPTAGLDVSIQGEVLNLMRDLQIAHNLTYLIISHNLPVVRHISGRLAIMYLGRIVEQGDCEAIFRRPAHPYTEALINGIPQPDPEHRRTLASIEGEVPSVAFRPRGCEFHARCRYAQARCREEPPEETVLSDGRTIRCHFPLTG